MANETDTDGITLRSERLRATIRPRGAELVSLLWEGDEWLWQGDPASWPRQAPVLFPHCGRTFERTIRVNGTPYPDQPIHGFAPNSIFTLTDQGPDEAIFTLVDDAETRRVYPFSFRLTVRFTVRDNVVEQTLTVANTSPGRMPVAAGFHPGFAWPLPGAGAREDHCILFEKDEAHPVALPNGDGLMGGATMPSPVHNRRLNLDRRLFKAGSAIFDRLESRWVWFGVPGRPGLRVSFDTPVLVLWRWPGPDQADYLCIEPWAGLPDPAGFNGELASKPGITELEPGEIREWTMRIEPGA